VKLLPSVRLASGAVPREVRRRLLLGFNTPFLPEVLVASSVMAEGVDLHLNCRHIIHHDLDWNPSVIEQRTGRVDRIGAKAEQVGRSIEVCLPFVGGTQDEKMYRVVMDRERWFQVVMGEQFRTDEFSTEEAALRVPLPEAVTRELTLRLEVP
jgi:superfamily II DNA/RNA helicase